MEDKGREKTRRRNEDEEIEEKEETGEVGGIEEKERWTKRRTKRGR
jgi:hypothetical protein